MRMVQEPQFVLRQHTPRVLFPKAILLVFLCCVLIFLVWLNAVILNLSLSPEFAVAIILLLLFLIALELYYTNVRLSGREYLFFDDRILHRDRHLKKQRYMHYSSVLRISYSRSVFDRLFNTGTIAIEPAFRVSHIRKSGPVYRHVERSVHHFRNLGKTFK